MALSAVTRALPKDVVNLETGVIATKADDYGVKSDRFIDGVIPSKVSVFFIKKIFLYFRTFYKKFLLFVLCSLALGGFDSLNRNSIFQYFVCSPVAIC